MTRVFLSYARGDDGEPFDPATSFVARLHRDLTAAGFDVWFDRVSMPSRTLTFHQEIRDAVASCDRLVLVVGPKAAESLYVRQEWQFAYFEAEKIVTPILRRGDFPIVPDELKLLHCEDFRDDGQYGFHLKNLLRQLAEPAPALGKLIGVPSLPPHFLSRTDRLTALRDALRTDLDRPVVITGAAARVGMHGMGGIGKSVLAATLARDRKIREAFPDGIVWVGLGQSPTVADLQRRVHKDLGGDGAFQTEHEGRVKLRDILKDKCVLLILDDIWHRHDVDWFDVLGSRCRAMITTRDAGLLTSLGGVHHQVELLTDAESLNLLAQAAGIEPDKLPSEAAAMIAECGRLPLAVALCGGLIRAGFTWAKVLEQLRNSRIDRIKDPHPTRAEHETIWNAIDVSVKFLSADEQPRFLELAVFPPDEATPIAALQTLWSHTAGFDDWDTDELVIKLSQRSLLELTTSADGQAISLHDLVYDYVHRATGDEIALHQRLLEAYRKKCPDGWPSGPNDGYFFTHLRRHFIAAGRNDEALALLMDFDWLQAKTHAGLITDLSREMFEAGQSSGLRSRDGLGPWYYFVRSNPQFLQQHPHCFFQQAFNEPVDSPVSRAARRAWAEERQGGVHVPHVPGAILEWTNRHQNWEPPACLMNLTGHQGHVNSVACSADGRTIVSGSDDKMVKVWDAETGACRQTLTGHQGDVHSVACSADGRTIVSASGDVKIWDAQTGACRLTLTGHKGTVESVACSSDGQIIVFLSDDETVKVWDARKGACHLTLTGHDKYGGSRGVACSADGKMIATASRDKKVKIWDAQTGACRSNLTGHQEHVTSVACSADGKMIVSASRDKMVKVWDAQTGACRLTLIGHEGDVWGVACSADGRMIISGSWDKTVKVWEAQTGTCCLTLTGHKSNVWGVACSADGSLLVSGSWDTTVKVWDAQTGACRPPLTGHQRAVTSVTCSADGRTLVSGSWDKTVKVWDAQTGACRLTLTGYDDYGGRRRVACSADGLTVCATSRDKTVKVWDAITGECRITLTSDGSFLDGIALSTDGRTLVSGSYDPRANFDSVVKVWDVQTGACLATHPKNSREAQAALAAVEQSLQQNDLRAAIISGDLVVETIFNELGRSAASSANGDQESLPADFGADDRMGGSRGTDLSPPHPDSSSTKPATQLIAPGPFWEALGPLVDDCIVAFNARGEAHWFRIRRRDETTPATRPFG